MLYENKIPMTLYSLGYTRAHHYSLTQAINHQADQSRISIYTVTKHYSLPPTARRQKPEHTLPLSVHCFLKFPPTFSLSAPLFILVSRAKAVDCFWKEGGMERGKEDSTNTAIITPCPSKVLVLPSDNSGQSNSLASPETGYSRHFLLLSPWSYILGSVHPYRK